MSYWLIFWRVVFLACCLFISNSWAKPLVIGSLGSSPSAEISLFGPLAKYLAAELRDSNIEGAEVKVARSHDEMAQLLKQGQVDLFIDSSISALQVQRLSGGEFLARRWKKGIGEYRSVIFVPQNSPIHRLDDLVGKRIAFEDKFSSSGYLLPASEILHSGLILQNQATANGVQFQFSLSDENTVLWVLNNRVDAGALSEDKFNKLTSNLPGKLHIIHHSITIPYHVVLVRADMPQAMRQRIHQLLLSMHQSEAGKKLLNEFEKTSQFDDIPDNLLKSLLKIKIDLPDVGK